MRGLAFAAAILVAATAAAAVSAEQRVAKGEGPGIVEAYFAEDADVYPHRVLGDVREKLALSARDEAGYIYAVRLYLQGNQRNVFEDIVPRLADVDGDGLSDVVVIETDPETGASLAVYGLRSGQLTKIAATPHIGRPFRWLAVAGIADFDGDGSLDIAYVETPHIGGILRIWSFAGGEARELAFDPGYSNHRIGQSFITGGVRDCGNGPELVLPNAGWTKTLLARFGSGVIEASVLAGNAAPETIARAMECK